MTGPDSSVVFDELHGRTFIQFCVGAGVRLDLDRAPHYAITIECPLTITGIEDPVEPTTLDVLGRLRSLLMSKIATVDHHTVTLMITFDEGTQIVVPPNEMYEAWQVNADDGSLVVCIPGGALSSWTPAPDR